MNIPNKCYDTSDGPIWGSRSIAVVHIIYCNVNDVMHMLITKRSDTMPDEPGKWCFPCGYLDWNETIEEAAIRETIEETTFDIRQINAKSLITSNIIIGIDSKPRYIRQNVSVKVLSLLDMDFLPTLSITDETSDVMWATGDDMLTLQNDFAFGHFETFCQSLNSVKRILENEIL